MRRCLFIACLLASGCKGKTKAAGHANAAGSGSAAYEPPPPPSRASASAAKTRKALFEKVAKLVENAHGDCARLGQALEELKDEAAAAHDAKYELLDADRTTDANLEAETIKPLLLGTAQCTDTSKIDAFISALAGVEARGSASDVRR